MLERLPFLWPEIALFVTTCVVMVLGLSRSLAMRKATALIAGLGIAAAGYLAWETTPTGAETTIHSGQLLLPDMVGFAKVLVAIVGLMLLCLMAGTVDRQDEEDIARGTRTFDPLRSNRAEFYAFYLFSLTGLMLCASADDLIWLFLALELTSLPTYIMVTISSARNRSREAGVKYFFLGAFGAAVFLYGFALLYGGTGTTNLNEMAQVFATQGINTISLAGIILSLLGLCFKIAAVPMHFYTADVYQGAASQVSAMLAFVPKAAGFFAILLICAAVGWRYELGHGGTLAAALSDTAQPIAQTGEGSHLPDAVRLLLWVVAALTMTVGNVLAVLQRSVKRILAYSSIAHSGYMLVGVIAGPGEGTFTTSGTSAVLFYLLAYGVMNVGAFAALASLERRPVRQGEEPRELDDIDDIRGLCKTHPGAGWMLVLCSLSLLGLPPLLGFFGKLPLFTSALHAGELPLVLVLGLNSAIAAYYYLRLAFLPITDAPDEQSEPLAKVPFAARRLGGAISAGGVVVLALGVGMLAPHAERAGRVTLPHEEGAPEIIPGGTLETVRTPASIREGDAPETPRPVQQGASQAAADDAVAG